MNVRCFPFLTTARTTNDSVDTRAMPTQKTAPESNSANANERAVSSRLATIQLAKRQLRSNVRPMAPSGHLTVTHVFYRGGAAPRARQKSPYRVLCNTKFRNALGLTKAVIGKADDACESPVMGRLEPPPLVRYPTALARHRARIEGSPPTQGTRSSDSEPRPRIAAVIRPLSHSPNRPPWRRAVSRQQRDRRPRRVRHVSVESAFR